MKIKDRKRTRLNRNGVIRLGCKVFWCKDGHRAHPTRWNGESKQACEVCGKIRNNLADKTTQPYQPGYFVLKDAPDVAAFFAAKGIAETEIRELDVLFPFADRDKNFIASYQVWAGGDIVCEGDGEYVSQARPLVATQGNDKRWRIKKGAGETLVNNGLACRSFDWNGTHFDEGDHVLCSGSSEDRLYPHCNLCKLNSMLKVMMADPSLIRVGYYRIATGSGRNYDHLDTMFDLLPPSVQGIVCKLKLVEEQTRYTDETGEHKTTKWFLHLEPDPSYIRDWFAMRAAQQIGQGIVTETPQIEAVIVSEDDPDWEEYDNGVADYNEEPEDADEPFDLDNPDLQDWDDFRAKSVKHLGFKDDDSVRAAYASCFPLGSDTPTMLIAWGSLREYKESETS